MGRSLHLFHRPSPSRHHTQDLSPRDEHSIPRIGAVQARNEQVNLHHCASSPRVLPVKQEIVPRYLGQSSHTRSLPGFLASVRAPWRFLTGCPRSRPVLNRSRTHSLEFPRLENCINGQDSEHILRRFSALDHSQEAAAESLGSVANGLAVIEGCYGSGKMALVDRVVPWGVQRFRGSCYGKGYS